MSSMTRRAFLSGVLLLASCQSKAASDLQCLADVIHAEARGESKQGQAAVGYTLLNRAAMDRKHGLCWHSRHGFKRLHAYPDTESYSTAALVMAGLLPNPIGNRTHFDSTRKPAAYAKHVKTIGRQHFYD